MTLSAGLALNEPLPKLSAGHLIHKAKCGFCASSNLRLEYIFGHGGYSVVCGNCFAHGPIVANMDASIAAYVIVKPVAKKPVAKKPKTTPEQWAEVRNLRAVNTAWTKISKKVGISVARCKACCVE